MKRYAMILCGVWMLVGCGTQVPEVFTEKDALPKIYPDYIGVTIPVNIAPLTFGLDEPADGIVARYAAGDMEIVCSGKMQPGIDEWHQLISQAAKLGKIEVDVYADSGG